MIAEDVPLIVCVTKDATVRERVAHQLCDCGVVVLCADIDELRAVLGPADQAGRATEAGRTPAAAATSVDAGTPAPGAVVALGDLLLDGANHLATWRGASLSLTRLEWELLGALAAPPNTIWTYERLFGAVWGGTLLGDTSILHSAIKRLRRKLREAGDGLVIETVRGVGYRLSLTVP
ncbi:MAG: winged helix-turn-helix domain-containing protein [Micromonosporaceae bacterium]